jgi:hypothetical protein
VQVEDVEGGVFVAGLANIGHVPEDEGVVFDDEDVFAGVVFLTVGDGGAVRESASLSSGVSGIAMVFVAVDGAVPDGVEPLLLGGPHDVGEAVGPPL